MQDWLTGNLTTLWAETQKRFMEGLYAVTPPPQSPVGISWWQEAYLQQLAQWEATVNQTLKAEETLIERWAGQASSEPTGTPPALSLWTGHMQGLLYQWVSIQHQLWDEFFSLLRGGAAALREPVIDDDLKESRVINKAEAGPGLAALPAAPALPEQAAVAIADDLQSITGIGPATAQKLRTAGITSFRQIALLDPAAIERIETTVIKWPGRIRRDHWIEQAKTLHWQKYRESL